MNGMMLIVFPVDIFLFLSLLLTGALHGWLEDTLNRGR